MGRRLVWRGWNPRLSFGGSRGIGTRQRRCERVPEACGQSDRDGGHGGGGCANLRRVLIQTLVLLCRHLATRRWPRRACAGERGFILSDPLPLQPNCVDGFGARKKSRSYLIADQRYLDTGGKKDYR
uniref:Uncharacterized protein n=1 Tax=Oryza barthii TaxID=65489 RepID=A0A0D3HAV0_9ORYZ